MVPRLRCVSQPNHTGEPPMTAARSLRRYVERASRPVLLQPATPPPGTRPLRAYQRRTKAADALIAGAYIAGPTRAGSAGR